MTDPLKVCRGLDACKEWGMTEKDCAGNGCPYEQYDRHQGKGGMIVKCMD